jgi:hypothetical protein
MNNHDDDPPAKVAPSIQCAPQGAPRALADELRRYYKTLVDQELPDKIAALYQRFDDLTKEEAGPEAGTPQGPEAAKKPPE